MPTFCEPWETWDRPCETPSMCGPVLPFLLKVISSQRVQWWILVLCTWTAQSGSLIRLDSLGRNNVLDLGPQDHRGLRLDRASMGMALSTVLLLNRGPGATPSPHGSLIFFPKMSSCHLFPWGLPLALKLSVPVTVSKRFPQLYWHNMSHLQRRKMEK